MELINRTSKELMAEINSLRIRLEESEETLRAISCGEVDAFVVSGPDGEQIFTLKGAEQPYRVLVESMNEGAATLISDGTIFYCNKRLADVLQVPLESLIGTQLSSYVSPTDQPLFLALLKKCVQEHATNEIAMINGAGKFVPVLISISALDLSDCQGISVVVTDLTARSEAEEVLQKFSKVVEQSPVCIVITDTTGAIEYVNPKFTDLTGYSMTEVMGQNPRILKSGETLPETYKTMWKTIANGETWQGVLHNRKKNDELYWEAATISALKNKDGVIVKYLAIKEDISDRKKTEEQLLQSQKMEVIGQLSGGIAHDLNNILTAIIGYSTLIEMKMSADDPKRDHLSHVLAASGRAAELTKSLLAFSRKQVINLQSVDLNQIISKTKNFMTRIIAEDIDFTVVFKKEALIVNADSGQIEQVLMNLVTNARDAMLTGGQLSIETEEVVLDDDFIKAHGFGELGSYALMTFSDSGDGMDSEICKKVFEPFFTTKEVGKGTGLGLSIIYGIIKQHNGFINVYSEPGNGTTFRVYLPLIYTAVGNVQDSKDEVIQRGTETILVADDNFPVRELLEKTLTIFGYTVISAVDGNDVVSKFREKQASINLVILDIVMPKMNGKEVYNEIKKINPTIKVIFMSGYNRDIIHKRGVLDDSVQFIPKPLNPKTLLLKVRNILDEIPNE